MRTVASNLRQAVGSWGFLLSLAGAALILLLSSVENFLLVFVLCFLLSDKAVKFAKEYEATMQLVEAFAWTIGDSNSILLSSM